MKMIGPLIRNILIFWLSNKLWIKVYRLYVNFRSADNDMGQEVIIFKKYCVNNKLSIDVGAYAGSMTKYLCIYSKHVYCYEPISELANRLKNEYKNWNVTVENCALGNEEGIVDLNIPVVGDKMYQARSSLNEDVIINNDILGNKITKIEKIPARVRKLDDYDISDVGFIKIDVEGYECEVLKGAIETIRKWKPNMLIEIEQRYHKERSIEEIFSFIQEIGYKGYFMIKSNLYPIQMFRTDIHQNVSNEENNSMYINNFLFVTGDK
jgi:FkbM family methyltransferase